VNTITIDGQIRRDGFAVIEHVVDDCEIDSVCETLERAPLERGRAGARHAMSHPVVAELASDARLVRIAQGVLGPNAEPYRATLFDKSADANWLVVWHQDTALPLRSRRDAAGWGPWSIKGGITYAHAPAVGLERILALRVHLDDSTARNGPLRVVPRSHSRGVLTDEEVQQLAREGDISDCIVGRGGVLAMRPLLIHSSSKARNVAPRRVLHIEYSASMDLGDGLELAMA